MEDSTTTRIEVRNAKVRLMELAKEAMEKNTHWAMSEGRVKGTQVEIYLQNLEKIYKKMAALTLK